jgi:hypothetical protein
MPHLQTSALLPDNSSSGLTTSDGDKVIIFSDLDVGAGLDTQTRDRGSPKRCQRLPYGIMCLTYLEPIILGKADRGRPVNRPT